MVYNDEYFMNRALKLAEQAFNENEIPVGAIIVKDNKIIAEAYNKKDSSKLVTQHAEIIAIESASKHFSDWRLNGCIIYVTMEPCPMCASAIQQSRITKIVYGCSSNVFENSKIIEEILQNSRFNHQVVIERGVLEGDCSKIIKKFFKLKR
ncbi:MAG: nucleoside deaminase [Bacilli bacterium]|nr:nucleoside deaminase [Bacilli bacterium]